MLASKAITPLCIYALSYHIAIVITIKYNKIHQQRDVHIQTYIKPLYDSFHQSHNNLVYALSYHIAIVITIKYNQIHRQNTCMYRSTSNSSLMERDGMLIAMTLPSKAISPFVYALLYHTAIVVAMSITELINKD